MTTITAPRHEGTIRVRDGRQLGIAEYGPPDGRAVVWFHGTPGARRQVPEEARLIAESRRASASSGSTARASACRRPHLYDASSTLIPDVEIVADRLGLDRFASVGLSGGGPYALAAAHELGDRVATVGILGGVVPTHGPDAMSGGLVERRHPVRAGSCPSSASRWARCSPASCGPPSPSAPPC